MGFGEAGFIGTDAEDGPVGRVFAPPGGSSDSRPRACRTRTVSCCRLAEQTVDNSCYCCVTAGASQCKKKPLIPVFKAAAGPFRWR